MKRIIITALFLCLFLISAAPLKKTMVAPLPSANQTILVNTVPGLVSENNYEQQTNAIADGQLRKVLGNFNITTLRSVFRNRYNDTGKLKEPVAQTGKSLLSGWFELELGHLFNADELICSLKQLNAVIDAVIDMPMPLRPDIAPDDTDYGSQWHLNNPLNPNFDIDAEAAWNINRGRNDVIIAVLDGGVDYNHTDLDPGNRSRVIQGIDTGDDDNDPMDNLPDNHPESFAGHGTKIAGVIGARTDNGQHVAGVMWNCKIMPVKMVRSGSIGIPHIINWDWSASAFPSDVADAIDYAVSHGAHVINLSYSFPDMGWPINDMVLKVPLLYQAIDNAYKNNVVITASMGNDYGNNNATRYPAGFDEQVMAVGATEQNGARRSSSNTGSHISLSAPGANILTTSRGGSTDDPSGTSFSAPIVAGVAGLVISQGKDRNFNLTNDDVRHILELTANGQAGPNPGFDNETGHGIVNAHHALQLLDEPNVLYHYNSVGGTATKINTFKWVLQSPRWGIAAGAYPGVEQYKVTKHVTFDVPFCSPPQVWMRDRQSKCLSYGSPNDGRPYAIISNVTTTGFDVEYAIYYVGYNMASQYINKWIPATAASTNVAYTVVGEPNLAVLSTIAGPSLVCTSGSTFTLNNVPAGATVTWQATTTWQPGTRNILTATSGSGTTAALHASSSSVRGSISLIYTIQTSCGTPITISKGNIWVGKPWIDGTYNGGQLLAFTPYPPPPDEPIFINDNYVCFGPYNSTNMVFSGASSGSWQRVASDPYISFSQSGNDISFYFWAPGQSAKFRLTTGNACGIAANDYNFRSIDCGGGDPCDQYLVSPNPAGATINVVAPTVPPPCEIMAARAGQSKNNEQNDLVIKSIVLVDGNGEKIYKQDFTADTKNVAIDASGFRKGVYFLKISGSERTETHRIVIK